MSAGNNRSKPILMVTTADTLELARQIASTLVDGRMAGCVNILPQVRSIYCWEGKVCDESEFMLLIKTRHENFEKVRAEIKRLHSYDVPEIISVAISESDPEYLKWLQEQC